MKKAVLVQEPAAVISRVQELGIPDPEILRVALEAGELERSSHHRNVPAMSVGCIGWGVSVGELRNRLAPYGWIANSEGRLETTLNLKMRVAVAITSGDEATGRADQTPKTKHKKGVATEAAIEENAQQLSLFSTISPSDPAYEPTPQLRPVAGPADVSPPIQAEDVPEGVMLWVLLKARDRDQIRCELSLPLAYGIDGYVNMWAERIILPPIDLDGAKKAFTPLEPTPSIEVSVTRRGRLG